MVIQSEYQTKISHQIWWKFKHPYCYIPHTLPHFLLANPFWKLVTSSLAHDQLSHQILWESEHLFGSATVMNRQTDTYQFIVCCH